MNGGFAPPPRQTVSPAAWERLMRMQIEASRDAAAAAIAGGIIAATGWAWDTDDANSLFSEVRSEMYETNNDEGKV